MRKHNLNVPLQMPSLIRTNVRVCYCHFSNAINLVFLPQSPRSHDWGKKINSLHFRSQTKLFLEVLIDMNFMVECHHSCLKGLLG